MNGRASKEGLLKKNPKYKHKKIQAMITWNAEGLFFPSGPFSLIDVRSFLLLA